MPTVIVKDASCLIDLKKGRLLHAMLGLPFEYVIPFLIRMEELIGFTPQEWHMLEDGGVEINYLPPDGVAQANALKARHPKLSANDSICLVTTLRYENAILLTGDGALRRVAEAQAIEVHGVLWMVDQLRSAGAASTDLLRSALEIWRDDPAVRLPGAEIQMRLRGLPKGE